MKKELVCRQDIDIHAWISDAETGDPCLCGKRTLPPLGVKVSPPDLSVHITDGMGSQDRVGG